MRNQNIYTSAISHGLILTSPQTAKPVLQSNGQPIPREFALIMRNDTNDVANFSADHSRATGERAGFLSAIQFADHAHRQYSGFVFGFASSVSYAPMRGARCSFPVVRGRRSRNGRGDNLALTASILFNADPTNPVLANPG